MKNCSAQPMPEIDFVSHYQYWEQVLSNKTYAGNRFCPTLPMLGILVVQHNPGQE